MKSAAKREDLSGSHHPIGGTCAVYVAVRPSRNRAAGEDVGLMDAAHMARDSSQRTLHQIVLEFLGHDHPIQQEATYQNLMAARGANPARQFAALDNR